MGKLLISCMQACFLISPVNSRHDLEVWSCFIKVSVVVIDGDSGTDAATNQVQQYLPVQPSLIGDIIKSSYYTNLNLLLSLASMAVVAV